MNRDQLQELSSTGPSNSWAVYVTTQGDQGEYSTNQLRFSTRETALEYAQDLMGRWLAVVDFIVVPSEDSVTVGVK